MEKLCKSVRLKMFTAIMKRLVWLLIIGVVVLLGISSPAQAQEEPTRIKQLNFVFLHGAGGNASSMQLLSDIILEQIEPYILAYEAANPVIDIHDEEQANLNGWARTKLAGKKT